MEEEQSASSTGQAYEIFSSYACYFISTSYEDLLFWIIAENEIITAVRLWQQIGEYA